MQIIKITHLDGNDPFNFFCPVTGAQIFSEDGQDTDHKSIVGYWDCSSAFEAAQLSPELETAWKAFVKEKAADIASAAERYLLARGRRDHSCEEIRNSEWIKLLNRCRELEDEHTDGWLESYEVTEEDVLEFIQGYGAPTLLAVHFSYSYGIDSYASMFFVFDLEMMHPIPDEDSEV